MATNYDTQAMGPGLSHWQMTTAPTRPPNDKPLQVLLIEPRPGTTNADPDDPEKNDVDAPPPLGFKLTGYKLLNIVVKVTFGVDQFISLLKGQSIAPMGLYWVGGSVLAILLYCIGLYEAVESPRWRWFFHVDWAPAIAFSSKCFLGGVLWCLLNAWGFLPFALPISMAITRLALFPNTSIWTFVNGFLSGALGSVLREAVPTKWLVWERIPVWAPVRRFFHRYGSGLGNSAGGQYRVMGNVGFCLGLLFPSISCLMAEFATTFLESRRGPS